MVPCACGVPLWWLCGHGKNKNDQKPNAHYIHLLKFHLQLTSVFIGSVPTWTSKWNSIVGMGMVLMPHLQAGPTLQAYLSVFKCIQVYSSVFKCIQVYSSVFKCIQVYSGVFKCIQVYSCLFLHILAHCCVFFRILGYSCLLVRIWAYWAYSSVFLLILAYS